MIFLTVGGSNIPFDRLAGAVDLLAADELVVAQLGPARISPATAVAIPYLPLPVMQRCVREARVVVAHAGIGAVAMCLRMGKRPVVVPRRKDQRESVDDHQVAFAHRVAKLGVATVVEDIGQLPSTLAQADDFSVPDLGTSRRLVDELVRYVESAVATG